MEKVTINGREYEVTHAHNELLHLTGKRGAQCIASRDSKTGAIRVIAKLDKQGRFRL